MKTFVFVGEAPAKLNVASLQAEVRQHAPEAVIEFHEGGSWERWPYSARLPAPEHITPPENLNAPYTQPDILIVRNVPEQYTKLQVGNFLRNHVPAKSTLEEEREKRADGYVKKLLLASDAELLRLKQRLAAL